MSGLGHGYDLNHIYSKNKTYWFDMGEVRGTQTNCIKGAI